MGCWMGLWPQDDARKAKKNAKSSASLKMLPPLRCRWSMSRYSGSPLMTFEQHIPAIYHHQSIFGLEKGSRAGLSCNMFGTQLPQSKDPTEKQLKFLWKSNEVSHFWTAVFNIVICWHNAHRRLHHPQKKRNSDVGISILLFKQGTNAWWICINLAQAFDDIMQSLCHSYVGCSIHWAIDIWIIWDIKTSTTVWSLKCRKAVEMHENDQGRDCKDPCLCLEGYCILLPAPASTRAHMDLSHYPDGSLFHEGINQWMNGWMDTKFIHFIVGVWPVFYRFTTSYLPIPTSPMSKFLPLFGCRGKDSTSSQGGVSFRDAGGGLPCVWFW